MTAPWEQIRQAYLTSALSAAAVARQFGLKPGAVQKRAREENWAALRAGAQQETSPRQTRLERVDALADTLLGLLERAAGELALVTVSCREKTKTDAGEITREYQQLLPREPGTVDRGGLKQLTAVLKDIKDVLMLRSEADLREQEARIAKLQRDLAREEAAAVTVTLAGGAESYAD